MGQTHSCTKSSLDDVVIPSEDEMREAGSPSDFSNRRCEDSVVITNVARRHKQAKHAKQRELMVAGLQVRQLRGESISDLLKGLPYGSIVELEVNTHFFVAEAHGQLKLSIYQNLRGNIQLGAIESQEGIYPPELKEGQILVTVNGKAIKTVDQAVQLLSMPERLLIAVADAPLDKKQHQRRKGSVRMVNCQIVQRNSLKSVLDTTPPQTPTMASPIRATSSSSSSGSWTPQDSPENRRQVVSNGNSPIPGFRDPAREALDDGDGICGDKSSMPLTPGTNVTNDTMNTTQDEDDLENEFLFLNSPKISNPIKTDSKNSSSLEFVSNVCNTTDSSQKSGSPVSALIAKDSSEHEGEYSRKTVAFPDSLKKLDSFLDDTMMELAYVMTETEERSDHNRKKDGAELEMLAHELRHRVIRILEQRQRVLKKDEEALPTIQEQPTQDQYDALEEQLVSLKAANAALKNELLMKDAELHMLQHEEQKHDQVKTILTQ